jgi:integrase
MATLKVTAPTELRQDRRGYWYVQWTVTYPDGTRKRPSKRFGRDYAEAVVKLEAWLAEWRAVEGVPASDRSVTVAELWARYRVHTEQYYRHPDGTPTGEAANISGAIRPFVDLFGAVEARSLKPRHLKRYRETLVERDLARSTINKQVNLLKRWMRWAAEEEHVGPDVAHGWSMVRAIPAGRGVARETEPVDAVPDAWVDAVLSVVPPTIGAMIRLQLLSGMRPGEVCRMRPCDLTTSRNPWVYQQSKHKTAHLGKRRRVYLGPEAQAVIRPFLQRDLQAHLFTPTEAQRERDARRRERYHPPEQAEGDYRQWPSYQQRARSPYRNRRYRDHYVTSSYAHAIHHACDIAGVPRWSPNRLRHNAEQRIERWLIDEQGVRPELARDAARAILGHSRIETTAIYAARDSEEAAKVMERIG